MAQSSTKLIPLSTHQPPLIRQSHSRLSDALNLLQNGRADQSLDLLLEATLNLALHLEQTSSGTTQRQAARVVQQLQPCRRPTARSLSFRTGPFGTGHVGHGAQQQG